MHYRKRNRLSGHDYTSPGYYFLTICTHNRHEWFGRIERGEMHINSLGEIAKERWGWLGRQYPHVSLDEYVILPNHMHGILIIDPVGNGRDRSLRRKSLPSLVGAFKTTTSKCIHHGGWSRFKWQKSFYDHIARNAKSLGTIREYIRNNAVN